MSSVSNEVLVIDVLGQADWADINLGDVWNGRTEKLIPGIHSNQLHFTLTLPQYSFVRPQFVGSD